MRIKRMPSGRNAYWFESTGDHQILHLGCFAEPLERSLDIYTTLLSCLYAANPSLWLEFQSNKLWWFNERKRDRKLSWKPPAYEDEKYLAYELTTERDIQSALKRFWLLKELRFYFGSLEKSSWLQQDFLPALARTEFGDLTQYVPTVTRFIASRDMCTSHLRVMSHRSETEHLSRLLRESVAKFGVELFLEASFFKDNGGWPTH